MQRSRLSLDGSWDFTYCGLGAEPGGTRRIQVPRPWQAQFEDLRTKGGVGLYERDIEVPEHLLDGRAAFLHFGAVFHQATVWLNDHLAGTNEGGFLPFSFDVTDHLRAGQNVVVVRAESPTDDPASFPDAPFAEIPFGKQSWYGPLSGIWQSVFLEWRHIDHVERLRVRSDLTSGRVETIVWFKNPLSGMLELTAEIREQAGMVVAKSVAAEAGDLGASFAVLVPDPAAWSYDEPNLYTLEITLRRDGAVLDQHIEAFGFRTFEARRRRIFPQRQAIPPSGGA